MIESKKEMKQWIELERKVWIKRNYPSGVKKKVFRSERTFISISIKTCRILFKC